jgi:hypothetical protein
MTVACARVGLIYYIKINGFLREVMIGLEIGAKRNDNS